VKFREVPLRRKTDHPRRDVRLQIIGEIPGTDKKDEIVLIVRALRRVAEARPRARTDNAPGSAVRSMMESLRIIKAAGLLAAAPTRFIRIALWGRARSGGGGHARFFVLCFRLKRNNATELWHHGTRRSLEAARSYSAAVLQLDIAPGKVRGMDAENKHSGQIARSSS